MLLFSLHAAMQPCARLLRHVDSHRLRRQLLQHVQEEGVSWRAAHEGIGQPNVRSPRQKRRAVVDQLMNRPSRLQVEVCVDPAVLMQHRVARCIPSLRVVRVCVIRREEPRVVGGNQLPQ